MKIDEETVIELIAEAQAQQARVRASEQALHSAREQLEGATVHLMGKLREEMRHQLTEQLAVMAAPVGQAAAQIKRTQRAMGWRGVAAGVVVGLGLGLAIATAMFALHGRDDLARASYAYDVWLQSPEGKARKAEVEEAEKTTSSPASNPP